MDTITKYWFLDQFSLSRRLNRRELMDMCENAEMTRYKKLESIVVDSQENQNIYFLKKGLLKMSRYGESGNEINTSLLSKGGIFGIKHLLGEDLGGFSSAIALKDSMVCKVKMETMKTLMANNPSLNNYILKLSGLRIKRLEHQLEDLLFKTAQTRIQEFIIGYIKEYGQLSNGQYVAPLSLSNRDIASLTCTNRQKVNQVMNSMKHNGTIDFDRKQIKLLNQ